ncbi:MAG: GntR family transcriptional regulator [Brevinema sp.]
MQSESKYNIISNYIKEQITLGFLTKQIPSELDLAKLFKVSRMTARKAIELLVIENIVYQVPRLGTFVMDCKEKIEIHLGDLFAFQRQQKEIKSVVKHFQIVPAHKKYQLMFGIDPSDMVYEFSRVRYKNRHIFAYEQGVIPTKFLYLTPYILENSLTEYFDTLELQIGKIEKEFKALLANSEISNIFNYSNNSAILCIDFYRYLISEELFEYISVYYNQQICKFTQIVENPIV